MTFGRYLASIWPSIAVMTCAVAMVVFILAVGATSAAILVLASLILICSCVLVVAIDYARKRGFYRDLERCSSEIEHPSWMVESVVRPDFLEGEVAFDAIRAIAKAANDDVAAYRRQAIDYREYIETWVHEAKSPLAAAHLMLDNLREDTASEVSYGRLLALDDELVRVEGYIEQALFYARSEAVERDYLIRSHNLGDLVADAIKANAPALIERHIAPVRHNLDIEVFTDQKWIEFILGQVIQNTAKYACAEHPFIEFSAELVDAGLARERVELTVRDNGCGVSAADLPRVFDKGFTGENGRKGKQSTGIGLYLVKRLCDKMGVAVAASSVEGEGFTITFGFSTNKFQYFEQ